MNVINTYIDFYTQTREWCKKQDPPPIYCEIPDDLFKVNTMLNSDYTQQYSYTASMVSLPSVTTATSII